MAVQHSMAKRKADSHEESPHRKRQRTTRIESPRGTLAKVQTVQDLQQLLAFEQDAGPHVRKRILAFKAFLETIAYGKENEERSSKRAVLLEYLRSQTSQGNEDSSRYLADIIKTWNFATQANVESLYCSVAAVLALLLKTISGFIEFRESGNRISLSLLQDNQIKLFIKGLSASKAKEHLISPCLRLLTEIVSFDGGQSARTLFRQREVTFKSLDVFLSMGRTTYGGEGDSRRKSSVRSNALRYLYANLRLQSPAAKMNLIAQGKILRAVFESLSEDPPGSILELLDVLKKDVALDSQLSQNARSRIFNEWVLSRLIALYSYEEDDKIPEGRKSVHNSVHDFLLFLCTCPGHGLLEVQEQRGTGTEDSEPTNSPRTLHDDYLSDISPHRRNEHQGGNQKLGSLLQTLRPYANVLHAELVLAVFRKTPDLVSDYFHRKKSFSFDPKATATWLGCSSFIIAIIQLPLPLSLAASKVNGAAPPAASAFADHIMPLPLNRKVMIRSLNQSMALVKLLSTKLLIIAFEKFEKAVKICKLMPNAVVPESTSNMWRQFASDLTTEFCSRIPGIEHVIAQFRTCPNGNSFLQEALGCLLALYYKTVPQRALEAKLDISSVLSSMLQEGCGEGGVERLQLDHMLEVALCSPNMQWWHKSENMELSPFTTLLKRHIQRCKSGIKSHQLKPVLVSVIEEGQILHCDESMLSLDVLVLSLQGSDEWSPSSTVFEFLDNCILRFMRKPVHYFDVYSSILATAEIECAMSGTHIDLILVALLEQWPFLVKNTDASEIANVAIWLSRYIELSSLRIRHLCKAQRDVAGMKVLMRIRDQLIGDVKDKSCRSMLKRSLREPPELGLSIRSAVSASTGKDRRIIEEEPYIDEIRSELSADLLPPRPPQEQDDHFGLNRWTRGDIQDAITNGAIEELFLCLCSIYAEIRQQAVKSITTFMSKLEASGYNGWRQTYVITGELIETATDTTSDTSLPYIAAILAARFVAVVADPLHVMNEKVNNFLHKGSRWDVTRLPSYWVDKIFLKPPTDDASHYQEAGWLLDVLDDGLRTSADFEIYRASHIFERLLSFSASPSLPEECFQKILDLLFRCTYVEGSSALITRCGVTSWISSRLALKGSEVWTRARLKTLLSRLYETSDQGRIDEWSDDTLSAALDNAQIPESE